MRQERSSANTARQRLAIHLRASRHALGLSQEALAAICGLHRTYVGSIERGERSVSLDNIERLAVALGLDICDLLAPVKP